MLSTCNRMELYVVAVSWHRVCASAVWHKPTMTVRLSLMRLQVQAAAQHLSCAVQGVREIEEWMSHSSGLSLDELRPHMFLLRDRDATGHLLK